MNLYFRLLWLIIRLPFLPRAQHPLDPGYLDMRVLPNDLDMNMHMNNGRYLTIMDLGRLHLTFVNGILWPCLKRRWFPVLGGAKVHFLKPLNPFNKFRLESKVIYWDEKWIYLEQQIYKKDQLVATALLKALFMGKEGKIKPETIIGLMPTKPTRPEIPQSLARWLMTEERAINYDHL